MSIKYYLQPNPITPDPNDQSARVSSNKVHDLNSITDMMLKRGSTVTKADVLAVLDIFIDVVTDEIADGNSVNIPLVNIRPSVTGAFTNVGDSFDPSRHVKRASISPGVVLMNKMRAAKVEKISQPTPAPVLIEFADVNTNLTNSMLTPGNIGRIMGEELKFNPANADEGIFFVDSANVPTKVVTIDVRTEGRLSFMIPSNLTTGSYRLEVRKAYGTTNVVVRTGSLSDLLQVP